MKQWEAVPRGIQWGVTLGTLREGETRRDREETGERRDDRLVGIVTAGSEAKPVVTGGGGSRSTIGSIGRNSRGATDSIRSLRVNCEVNGSCIILPNQSGKKNY